MKLYIGMFIILAVLMVSIPALTIISAKNQDQTKNKELSSSNTEIKTQQTNLSNNDNKSKSFSETKIKVLDHKTDQVKEITLGEYIKGVVLSEMPATFHEEAIKAQTVAANTYLIRQIGSQMSSPSAELKGAVISTDPNKYQGYMSDSTAKNFYKEKYEEYEKKVADCVYNVIDRIILYNDKPIIAAYHSMSNGMTESAENVWGNNVPYLQPVDSQIDKLNQNYESEKIIDENKTKEIIISKNNQIFFPEDKNLWFQTQSKSKSGSISEVLVGNISFSGNDIRNMFGLNSSTFEITYSNGNFTFKTKGFGHGVGMSQYGANTLAKQGKKFDEILSHYYNDIDIKSVYDIK